MFAATPTVACLHVRSTLALLESCLWLMTFRHYAEHRQHFDDLQFGEYHLGVAGESVQHADYHGSAGV